MPTPPLTKSQRKVEAFLKILAYYVIGTLSRRYY
jgi:hypothetical protein